MICTCPRCSGGVQNRPDLAGRMIACPHCGQQYQLPPFAIALPVPTAMPSHYATPAAPNAMPAPQTQPASTRSNSRGQSPKKSRDNTPAILMIGSLVALPMIGIAALMFMSQSSDSSAPSRKKPTAQVSPTSAKKPKAEPPVAASQTAKRPPAMTAAKQETNWQAAKQVEARKPDSKQMPTPSVNYESASDSVPFDTLIPNMPSSREVFAGGPPTRARFNSIKVGMTKAEIFELLGPIESFARSQADNSVTYLWGNPDRGQITVVFKNDKVDSMSQVGLK